MLSYFYYFLLKDGGSFIIKNQGNFTKTLLPYYYKHSNMASFVVSVADSVCTIDAESAVAAELSPLECHYEPPAMKVFKLAGDMTFTITNEGLQTAAGTCALRQ